MYNVYVYVKKVKTKKYTLEILSNRLAIMNPLPFFQRKKLALRNQGKVILAEPKWKEQGLVVDQTRKC